MPTPSKRAAKRNELLQVPVPPRPRKKPRQGRSVALVESLKSAGRQILESEGRAALTLQRLSEFSGVAVSSIYEYFPTLDALVAAIFDDYRQAAYHELAVNILDLPESATLRDGLLLAVRELLRMRLQYRRIDQQVEAQCLRYSELQRLEVVREDPVPQALVTEAIARRFAREIDGTNQARAIYLFTQSIQALVRIVALERPEYLSEADTATRIANMLNTLLASAADSDT